MTFVFGFLHNSQQDSRIKSQSATIVRDRTEVNSQAATISALQSQQSLQTSALQAATTYGMWVSSYDYSNLTAPTSTWTLIEAHSTQSFQATFDKTKANLTLLVTNYNASATGKVVAVGTSSLSNSRAVVLVFIDQTVTNKLQTNGPTTEPLRAELVLVRSNGQWLIDDLQVPS